MKNETILSILKEIRDILKNQQPKESLAAQIRSTPNPDEVTITIPKAMTAKEIYEESKNKTSKGTPLLYSVSWYKDEDFFTTEKTRVKTFTVNKTINHKGKTWQECKDIVEKANGELLSFAEWLYILWSHEKNTGERLFDGEKQWEYTWTSSRVSDGRLVLVGGFDADGAFVGGRSPAYRYDALGVSFSRSV